MDYETLSQLSKEGYNVISEIKEICTKNKVDSSFLRCDPILDEIGHEQDKVNILTQEINKLVLKILPMIFKKGNIGDLTIREDRFYRFRGRYELQADSIIDSLSNYPHTAEPKLKNKAYKELLDYLIESYIRDRENLIKFIHLDQYEYIVNYDSYFNHLRDVNPIRFSKIGVDEYGYISLLCDNNTSHTPPSFICNLVYSKWKKDIDKLMKEILEEKKNKITEIQDKLVQMKDKCKDLMIIHELKKGEGLK